MAPSWVPPDADGGANGGGSSGGGSSAGTSGASGPGAAATAQPGRRGGIALDLRRGETSKQRLRLDWTYPVWKPDEPGRRAGATTAAVETEHALPLDDAYRLITDGDRRPLLILRECELCKGTDHALLSRTLDNEQTVLLAHWFRCVKLPPNVLGEQHPFTRLFARSKPGERVPHLFFCDPDGSNKQELPGDQSQGELWATMFGFLDRCYEGNAKKALKDLRALLSQFDKIDGLEQEVMTRLDSELDRHGPNSAKAARYRADLDKLHQQREGLFAKEREIRDLALCELDTGAPRRQAHRD